MCCDSEIPGGLVSLGDPEIYLDLPLLGSNVVLIGGCSGFDVYLLSLLVAQHSRGGCGEPAVSSLGETCTALGSRARTASCSEFSMASPLMRGHPFAALEYIIHEALQCFRMNCLPILNIHQAFIQNL